MFVGNVQVSMASPVEVTSVWIMSHFIGLTSFLKTAEVKRDQNVITG